MHLISHTMTAIARLALLLMVTCAGCVSSPAEEIKVDINNSNRPVSEGTDPAFTPWSTNNIWYSGGSSIIQTFGGVTVRFTTLFPAGADFRPGYWKTGVQGSPPSGTLYNCKLAGDGIKVTWSSPTSS